MRRPCFRLLLVATLAGALAAASDAAGAQDRPARSGYHYLAPETRAMQDDEFGNPGLFAIERGAELWSAPAGTAGKSCASCHGEARSSMKGVAASYPRIDATSGQLMNLERRINDCRQRRMQAEPFPYESRHLVALTAFVARQSLGLPVEVGIDGPAAPHYERGRAFFFQRRGQFDLSCSQCHDDNPGKKLRGEVLSEGHTNGFPAFKLKWQEVGSTHRQFRRCNSLARSTPYDYGSDEYVGLELYLAHRGRGLRIETPAVRP